jgi:hypothetical protein
LVLNIYTLHGVAVTQRTEDSSEEDEDEDED